LDERAEADRVTRRHEVQRPAEQRHPDGTPLLQRVGQRLGAERIDARPERDVGIARHLRLERDEPLHRLERWHPATPQEHLALEQRAVQRVLRQDARRGHPVTISTGTDMPSTRRGLELSPFVPGSRQLKPTVRGAWAPIAGRLSPFASELEPVRIEAVIG